MSLKTSYFALCMNDSLAGYKIPILKVVVFSMEAVFLHSAWSLTDVM